MTTLPLEDGSLWYEVHGDGETTLVFVHGGWLNGRTWKPQVEHFADDYRVVTLDVRGHGNTGSTDADEYSIELFADDLETLLSHLENDEKPILCGLSLGSMILQEYLSRHPDRAAGVILGGAVRSMPPVDVPRGLEPFFSPMPALSTSLSMTGPQSTFRSLLYSIRATTGEQWLSVDPDVRAAAMEAVGEISRTEFRKVFEALFRYDPPELADVGTPTLVVHGDQEAPPVKRQGQVIASTVEDGRHLVLSESGHLVNQDRPRAFNDVSAKFVGSLAV
ncbi:alpha/beta fold hydrolase [Natronobacterium gregoryi]|nr:alpha/beta hydrolase [Natronobacterium gregoryi]AFZ71793.1 putative hydrolase or acyltransferase of alpha/beta superfamily [Natronobacterium gregoryi SP2]PLK21083.1 alpha/beta hydrolase [Natronobacterium gregoryi SP2]SFI87699.1 Pimeloyl-ACP methyl ester carboxylesterase [Natronobacterium gregoryi]